MRWTKPTKGDERIIKRFAIFPILVEREYRWLEWCYIKQTWYHRIFEDDCWKNIAFVTEEDYDEYKYKE